MSRHKKTEWPCEQCGRVFLSVDADRRRGWGLTCSKVCAALRRQGRQRDELSDSDRREALGQTEAVSLAMRKLAMVAAHLPEGWRMEYRTGYKSAGPDRVVLDYVNVSSPSGVWRAGFAVAWPHSVDRALAEAAQWVRKCLAVMAFTEYFEVYKWRAE